MEPLPSSSPLWGLPNVLLSPHCADRTADFQADAMRFFATNAARYREGQHLLNIVDKARPRASKRWWRDVLTRRAACRKKGTERSARACGGRRFCNGVLIAFLGLMKQHSRVVFKPTACAADPLAPFASGSACCAVAAPSS